MDIHGSRELSPGQEQIRTRFPPQLELAVRNGLCVERITPGEHGRVYEIRGRIAPAPERNHCEPDWDPWSFDWIFRAGRGCT